MARKKITYTPPKVPSLWPRRLLIICIIGAASFYLWQQRVSIAEFIRKETPVVRKSAKKTFQQAQSTLSPGLKKTQEFTASSLTKVKDYANVALRNLSGLIAEHTAKEPSLSKRSTQTPVASKIKSAPVPASTAADPETSELLPSQKPQPPPVVDYTNVTQYRGPPKTSNPQDYKPHPLKHLEIGKEPSIPPQADGISTSQIGPLTIVSFNIRIFSDKSRTDKELHYIASILKRYDITAIQELRDEKVLQRTIALLDKMGFQFGYEISPPVGNNVKECYAFVFRKDKISIKQKGQLYRMKSAKFIRTPYFATFQAGNFDFTLLTIHLLYGNSKEERRPELLELAQAYKFVQDADPAEQDVILLGDFNFDPDDHGWQDLKKLATMTPLLKPPVKTTITDTSLYDNFWFQRKYVREYIGQTGVVKFDENIFNNDDEQAQLAVSDHRPIWARFDASLHDDD